MPKARIAEWILSLATSPERAASIVGDLLEGVSCHGIVWFWGSILNTALALVFRDVAANPARVFVLGLLGLIGQYALWLAIIIAGSTIGTLLSGVLFSFTGRLLQYPFWLSGLSKAHAPFWLVVVVLLVSMAVTQFYIGRYLARWSPGRELAPCVAQMIWALVLLTGAWLWETSDFTRWSVLTLAYQFMTVVVDLPLFAGAASVRRMRVRLSRDA